MTDIADTVAPKSDQMNADDLLAGPRTFTVSRVEVRDGGEQPVSIWFEEFPRGRPWKPSKGMRRALLVIWGKRSAEYVGRRITLWRNPAVTWAGQEIGGIQITHASHIDEPKTFGLTTSQKNRDPYTIYPLVEEPTAPALLNTRSKLAQELYAAMEAAKVSKDDAAAWLSNVIGRDVAGSKELTEDDARTVLSHLSEAS